MHHFTVSLAERGSEERRTATRALSQKLTDSFSHPPTELFNEGVSVLQDLAWKLNHVNSLENNVVGLHRV